MLKTNEFKKDQTDLCCIKSTLCLCTSQSCINKIYVNLFKNAYLCDYFEKVNPVGWRRNWSSYPPWVTSQAYGPPSGWAHTLKERILLTWLYKFLSESNWQKLEHRNSTSQLEKWQLNWDPFQLKRHKQHRIVSKYLISCLLGMSCFSACSLWASTEWRSDFSSNLLSIKKEKKKLFIITNVYLITT